MVCLRIITAVNYWLAVILLFFYSGLNLAQVNVRESAPVSAQQPVEIASPQVNSTPSTPVSAQAPVLPNLAHQIQQLQQEVLELRGLLEETTFELRRLKQQRLDDYLDLDKRLVELNRQFVRQPPAKVGPDQAVPPLVQNAEKVVDEKALYRKAIDQLLNQQDYQGAKLTFDQYMSQFPQGIYVPNVFYWQGQIFLANKDRSSAETAFKSLVDNFPGHSKTADGKYKLATIYHAQGKIDDARVLLEEVASGDSDAARLAKSFLTNQY